MENIGMSPTHRTDQAEQLDGVESNGDDGKKEKRKSVF
jgi:hypothetical protein